MNAADRAELDATKAELAELKAFVAEIAALPVIASYLAEAKERARVIAASLAEEAEREAEHAALDAKIRRALEHPDAQWLALRFGNESDRNVTKLSVETDSLGRVEGPPGGLVTHLRRVDLDGRRQSDPRLADHLARRTLVALEVSSDKAVSLEMDDRGLVGARRREAAQKALHEQREAQT